MVHFGIMLGSNAPLDRIIKLAQLAEEYGFDSVWTSDGAYGWDAFSIVTLVTQATSRIRTHMAVVNPYDRHPIKSGLAAMTAQYLANGRFSMTVAGGSRETLKSMGHDWVHPTLYCRELVDVMRRLWTGEKVDFNGETTISKGCQIWFDPPPKIPVFFGCQRKWMLQLAGEIADGVLINHGSADHLPWTLEQIRAGAEKGGRDLKADGFQAYNLTIGAMHEDKATSYEWNKFAIPYVFMNMSHWHMNDLGITIDDIKAIKEPLKVQTDETIEKAMNAVEDWMLQKFSLAGTIDESIRHVKGYFDKGVDGVVISIPLLPEGRAEKSMELMRDHLLPAFR